MFEPLPMLMGLFTYPRSELSSIYHKDVTVMLLMNYSHSAVLNLLPIYHLAVIKLVLVVGITSSCPYRVAIVLRCHQPIAELSAKRASRGINCSCLLGNTSMSMSACDNPCPYLIFVILFTQANFLDNKIYTEKRQFFALYL